MAARVFAAIGIATWLAAPSLGQAYEMVDDSPAEKARAPRIVSPSRVLAGVRGFPDETIRALAVLGQHPDWLRKAAANIDLGQSPAEAVSDAPASVRDAVGRLAQTPDLILIAADRPDEAATLANVLDDAPQGAELRLEQLREGYRRAERAGQMAWQHALENDPVLLGQYRDLVTRMTETERKNNPQFAIVGVTDRTYYYAAPPDAGLMQFATSQDVPDGLGRALEGWWRDFGPQTVDDALLSRRAGSISAADLPGAIIDLSPAARRNMWTDDPQAAGVVGVMPVLMQPSADQPPEARIAAAIDEQARLWSTEITTSVAQAEPPAPTEEPPPVATEPAPQPLVEAAPDSGIAYRDEVVYDDYGFGGYSAYPAYSGSYLYTPSFIYNGYASPFYGYSPFVYFSYNRFCSPYRYSDCGRSFAYRCSPGHRCGSCYSCRSGTTIVLNGSHYGGGHAARYSSYRNFGRYGPRVFDDNRYSRYNRDGNFGVIRRDSDRDGRRIGDRDDRRFGDRDGRRFDDRDGRRIGDRDGRGGDRRGGDRNDRPGDDVRRDRPGGDIRRDRPGGGVRAIDSLRINRTPTSGSRSGGNDGVRLRQPISSGQQGAVNRIPMPTVRRSTSDARSPRNAISSQSNHLRSLLQGMKQGRINPSNPPRQNAVRSSPSNSGGSRGSSIRSNSGSGSRNSIRSSSGGGSRGNSIRSNSGGGSRGQAGARGNSGGSRGGGRRG